MKELMQAMRRVRGRLRLRRLVHGAGTGFASGALAVLILLAVTSFVPLRDRWLIAAATAAGCTLLAAAGNALRPVDARKTARTADACGLQERCLTALELAGKPETEMIRIQRQDACDHLRTLDVKQIRPGFPRRQVIAGAVLLILCAGTLLLPGGGDRAVAARQALEQKTAQMAKAAEEAAEAEEAGLTDPEKARLRKLTADLKRDLNASRDELDVLVALDRAEQQLEKLHAERSGEKTAGDAENAMEAMSALAQAMQHTGMEEAAALSEALTAGNTAAMRTALSRLDAEQLKELAENLSGSAKSMAEQLAQAAGQGEITEAQLQAMTAALQNSAPASPLQQAISGMKAGLGAGQQSGNQNGQGPGGQGAGNQNGQSGGGAGTGSTNEEQQGGGRSGQRTGSGGSRPPEYKEGKYETIYDPEKAETASRDVMTEQHSLGKDSVQIETGPGRGTLEGDVPFRQVIGEYAEQEVQAAESARLTKEQKEWVDEYFRRLTDD